MRTYWSHSILLELFVFIHWSQSSTKNSGSSIVPCQAFTLIPTIINVLSRQQQVHHPTINSKLYSATDENPTDIPMTPCTRICRYNSNFLDGHVCIGCFRETYEIGAWNSMSAMEKHYALLDAVDRLEAITRDNDDDPDDNKDHNQNPKDDNSFVIDEATTGTSRHELLRQSEYWKRQAEST